LPHKAWLMADAILRTLYRINISKKHLLEWETAAATEHRLVAKRWAIAKQLAICCIVAIAIGCILNPSARLIALPWIALWLIAPVAGHMISTPKNRKRAVPTENDIEFLRMIGASTWGYFEQYVTAESNWLPPDNVQEYPKEKIAFRISPTNEGLFLVSGLVANKFGWNGLQSLVTLWEKNLATWFALEQLNGHHYNWYETRERKALNPRYVSTVDSGNLMACYLTLGVGIEDLIKQPIVSQRHARGAASSLRWLREIAQRHQKGSVRDLPGTTVRTDVLDLLQCIDAWTEPLSEFDDSLKGVDAFRSLLRNASQALKDWASNASLTSNPESPVVPCASIVAARFDALCSDIDELMPWLSLMLENNPSQYSPLLRPSISLLEASMASSLVSLQEGISETKSGTGFQPVGVPSQAGSLCHEALVKAIQQGSRVAERLVQRFQEVQRRCEEAAHEMNFRFLYNARRKLFSIGYNVEGNHLDRSHYDLLCSECRLASYLAIAKGDVETEHWFRLGRQATQIHGRYTRIMGRHHVRVSHAAVVSEVVPWLIDHHQLSHRHLAPGGIRQTETCTVGDQRIGI
jgi:cyclic beta-1,2-glucan synthetase